MNEFNKNFIFKKKEILDLNLIIIVLLIGFLLYTTVGIYNKSVFTILFLSLFLLKIESNENRVVFILTIFFLNIAYNLDVFNFSFFPQARVLIGQNPMKLLMQVHPHSLRFVVAYPAVKMTEWFLIDIDTAYSYYCIFLLSVKTILIKIIIDNIKFNKLNKRIIRTSLIMAIIIFLGSIMNGRLIPALVGMSLILNVTIQLFLGKIVFNIKVMIIFIFAWILTTVSSGAMLVAFLQILFSILIYSKINKSKKMIYLIGFIFAPIIIKIIKFIILMINKNISFFGGGLDGAVNMLNHGIGKIFAKNLYIIILFIPIVIIVIFSIKKVAIWALKQKKEFIPLIISVPICIAGGMFGISTGLMIIPTAIVVMFIICGI